MTDFLVGGYTADIGGDATGIGSARSHPDGRFEYLGVLAQTDSPSWITVDGDHVHATLEGSGEVASWVRSGGVDGAAVALEAEERVGSGGTGPCHLAVVRGARVVANYVDGTVAVIGGGAAVGEDPVAGTSELQRLLGDAPAGPLPAQQGPHAHHVLELADGRVLTVDLGTDRLYVHEWNGDSLERVGAVPMPAGTGPRDLLPLPDGRLAVLGEWSCELLLLEPRGETFEVVQILGLPGAVPGDDQAAALGLSADGRHVFAGIRGADRIATMALDADTAYAVGWVASGGRWPRHLVVDGALLHVANQLSSTVTTFRIGGDGTLESVGAPVAVPSPTCLAALPAPA